MRSLRRIALAMCLLVSACLAQTVTIDANLQALPGWKSHAGGNIGGGAPKIYTMSQFPAPAALFDIVGNTGEYDDVDWYITRPVPANTGNLCRAFTLIVDQRTANGAQALERDTVLTTHGLTSNFSFQINVAGGWKLQISNETNNWVDTGYTIAPLTPNTTHTFLLVYSFNLTGETYSFVGISIDGAWYPIPASLQNLHMQHRGWGDGAIDQFQEDAVEDGAYSEVLLGDTFIWR